MSANDDGNDDDVVEDEDDATKKKNKTRQNRTVPPLPLTPVTRPAAVHYYF